MGTAQANLVFRGDVVDTVKAYVTDLLPNCTLRYDGVIHFIPIPVDYLAPGYNQLVGVPIQFSQTFTSLGDPTLDFKLFCGHINKTGYFYSPSKSYTFRNNLR